MLKSKISIVFQKSYKTGIVTGPNRSCPCYKTRYFKQDQNKGQNLKTVFRQFLALIRSQHPNSPQTQIHIVLLS